VFPFGDSHFQVTQIERLINQEIYEYLNSFFFSNTRPDVFSPSVSFVSPVPAALGKVFFLIYIFFFLFVLIF